MTNWSRSLLCATLIMAPAPLPAECQIQTAGSKCVTVPQVQQSAPDFPPGAEFPVYAHSMLLDPARFGLPPVSGAWRYYRVDGFVYRVDALTYRVLEVIGRR